MYSIECDLSAIISAFHASKMVEVSSDSMQDICETAVDCPILSACSQHNHSNLDVLISDN